MDSEDTPIDLDAPAAGDSRIPSYERLMLPFLRSISNGQIHKEADLLKPLAFQFDLTDENLRARLASGPSVFANRIRWAKVNLRQAGLLSIPSAGFIQITDRGSELLAEEPREISRQTLKRYSEYQEFLGRSRLTNDDAPLGNIWIEKTLVEGRPDRNDGPFALGSALWSPQKADNGSDIYRFMRDVRPGDIVMHLTDNKAFTGISLVEQAATEFNGLEGTNWANRPSLFIRLRDFRRLDPILPRSIFFSPPYGKRLSDIRQSGQRNLFYTEKLDLVQGGYLTPCPPELITVLNDAYTALTGEPIVDAPAIEVPATEVSAPFSMETLISTTLWTEEELNELLDSLSPERSCKQIILAGPPGTGKTWVAQQVVKFLTGGEIKRSRLVQFHPSYSYEQFIEGLRPEASGDGITFRAVDGIMLEIAHAARNSPKSHFLLIDEMNRANLSRVLGELLYLFEYRRESIDLPYTRAFSLPENLFFIGTMNTADRSIRSVDAALRRRFEIFECLPNRAILERYYETNTNQISNLFDGFDKLNELLTIKLDRHHTIGHTFFMSTVFSPRSLSRVWKRQVKPLIEEYFFDQPDQSDLFELSAFWPGAAE